MATNPDGKAWDLVASKRKIPRIIDALLAADKDEKVRNTLAHNAKATEKVQGILIHDSWELIKERAHRNALKSKG